MFKMHKVALMAAMATSFSLVSVAVNATDSGTINVKGELTEVSCVIPADQLSQRIDLGNFSATDLAAKAAGEVVLEKSLQLDVANCPASVSGVGVTFSFNPDADNPDYLANTGNAKGIAFSIADQSNNVVNSGSTVASTDYDAVQGSGAVKAKIKAIRVGSSAPVEGNIESIANIVLQIN